MTTASKPRGGGLIAPACAGTTSDEGGGMQTEDEDADIEAALDTSDEMSVGEALRRRRSHKEKRSIAKRHGPSKLGAGGTSGTRPRRASSAEADTIGMLGISSRHMKRRQRRNSLPSFTLSDGDSDGLKLERLNSRLEAMRRLPRGSRYASQQMEIIQKAMEILNRSGGAGGSARTAPENDELSRLLAAVSL